MLNPTKEIRLEKKWQKRYSYLRYSVYVLFFLIGIFVAHRILFPSASFVFFFQTPNAAKNSILNPRSSEENLYENGDLSPEKNITFDTALVGDYSRLSTTFDLENKSPSGLDGKIEIKKSYQAFFYPEDGALGFKDGTLLREKSNYFIVSDGAIREFSSIDALEQMGFRKESFLEATPQELSIQPRGNDILTSSKYPSDTLFRIQDEYFQLKNGSLKRFVSERAYLTQYSPQQAIEKDVSFLDEYTLSQDYIGFADGTLLSADISVYITSGNDIYPVNNPVTFESMGYAWSDLISANSEEIGIYERQKLFTLSSPHPDGTVFYAIDSGKYYYIQNKTKKEIISANILSTYRKSGFIEAEEKSLSSATTCDIVPQFRLLGFFRCEADIDSIRNFKGNDYQFSLNAKKNVKIHTLDVEFSQVLNWKNMLKSLSSLKSKITNNYVAK